ncbi:DUF3857 domain-containing protein [Flavobacterium longum]|uniref:DUF3857 domain-containing protein n=1 Tax=Flavobacterium longum TaxID=1299340 RepID=UPI0039E746ED
MRNFLAVIAFLAGMHTFAQVEEVKNYTWQAVPKFREIPKEFESYPAVVLKDYRLYENRIGQYAYKAFVVKHTAIKILTDDGINNYNKVSINKKYVRDYRDLQARVIKPDGKIIPLAENRIIEKEKSDEKQFVFEGVEKGDIIEYYYVIKDYPDFNNVEYFQRDIPVLEGKFQLNRIPEGKAYFLNVGMNEQVFKKHHLFTVSNLPAYKEEISATNLANLTKVYYFVSGNFNYDFDSFYWELNGFADGVSAKSMVKDFIKELQLDDASVPVDDRLKKMDIFLKENIEIDRQYQYKKILETKKMMPAMALYLYKDVLDALKIPYKFMVSTDKFDNAFQKSFAIPSTLTEILIYIPETKKYIMPFYYWMPYGPPSSVCLNNDAVVYHPEKKKVTYEYTKIGGVSMEDNVNHTFSEITVDADMETVSVKKKSDFTGYRAYYYRSVLKDIPEDKIKEFVGNAVFNDIDIDLKKHEFKNKEYRHNYGSERPFTFETEAVIKESWLENAGKNYLITLGKVLGDQTNLYQETERKYPIDIAYPRKFIHAITLNIPDGYTVKDVNTLIFNKELKDDEGNVVGKFTSSAAVNGKKVEISIEEFYDFTHLGVEKYPQYRDVMNAAYDFYKSALVLVKV